MQEPARAMEGFREKTGPGSVSMIARSTTAQETFRLGPGGLPGSTSTASKASSITCSVMVSSALRILLWPLTLITVVNVDYGGQRFGGFDVHMGADKADHGGVGSDLELAARSALPANPRCPVRAFPARLKEELGCFRGLLVLQDLKACL